MAIKTKYSLKELTELGGSWFGNSQLLPGAIMPVNVTMAALAEVESDGHLNAKGDGGKSLGLWQINTDVWGRFIGPGFLLSIEDQVEVSRRLLGFALEDVQWAILQRSLVDPLLPAPALPERLTALDAAIWISIIWQYGATQFRDWIAESSDHTAAGFKQWRKDRGTPVHWSWPGRLSNFKRYYAKADGYDLEIPSFFFDVVGKTGTDIVDIVGGERGLLTPEQEEAWGWKGKARFVTLALIVGGLFLVKPLIDAGAAEIDRRGK